MLALLMVAALAAGAAQDLEIAPDEHLNVRDHGAGRTIVLVPGLTGCAYGFRHLIPGLTAAGCRVIVIEPLGIGASARPAGADYSLTAQADRIGAAMDRLGAGPGLVVGHGVSGSMVLRLAYRRPDLVAGVVLIEGGPDENGTTPTVKRSLGLASLAAKLGGGRLLRDRFQAGLEEASGDRSWIDGLTVKRYFAGAARDLHGTIAALRAMADASEPESLRANLDRISCGVTLLLGAAPHEGSPPPADVALLDAQLADFRSQSFAGAGHYLFEEVPDAVTAAILAAAQRPQVAGLPGIAQRSTP
ncbi:MAG: alpha/beta fold hydrolase [Krumholzibacteria bacterium]|nr:alpha/beta fold hydrolase [Candidatus Krumholzibacteria bacterium]